MVKFLHWNMCGNAEKDYAVSVCRDNDIDIAIFSEFEISDIEFLTEINKNSSRNYYPITLNVTRVKIFTSMPFGSIAQAYEDRHVAIHHFTPPIGESIIILSAHLPSKLKRTEEEQYHKIRQIMVQLNNVEENFGHSRSIVIGDLNINPFDKGMLYADGFHAVADKFTANKISRTFQDQDYKYMYNPMWGKLGDDAGGPPGTYYFKGSKIEKLSWNSFDQILIRPQLLKYYHKDSVEIITEIAGKKIFDGNSIVGGVSDHLPVVVTIDI